MRYTKKEITGIFGRLLKAIPNGHRLELYLDYNACYGGYVIVKAWEDSSESHPFGSLRRSSREMYLSMLMAAQALESLNEKT